MKSAVARARTSAKPWPETRKEELLDLLPDQGYWTEQKYLWLTDTTRRLVEFSDGYVEVLPMPTVEHQVILQRLFLALLGFVDPEGGIVIFSGLRLRLWPDKIREPDVLLLRSKDDPRNQNRFWTGADLVLEVVSEDDRDRDLVVKRSEYARAGIPEYWIVDPKNHAITVLTLGKKRYRRHGTFKPGQTATSPLLPGFTVDVAAVFAGK